MTRRVLALGGALALTAAAPAAGSSWPLAGGNASRSGTQGLGAGEPPVAALWARGDTGIRTPVIVTGGPPAAQRVAYGTTKGAVHLQALESGAPVGPEEGVVVVDAAVDPDLADTFGAGATTVGFADTSTVDRLGVVYVVHNDGQGVEVARIDATTGARVDAVDTPVGGSLGCTANGSPVLSPPTPAGSRILFLTLRGTCPADQTLVRIPIEGDAAAPSATFGTQTFGRVAGIAAGVGPSLVVLRGGDGAARFHVAVGRDGGVDFFDAGHGLSETPAAASAPDLPSVPLPGEVAMTVSAPAAASGLVAGAEGSGATPAPALYVAAAAGGQTRVHRLVQPQPGATVAVARSIGPIADSGVPAPALAVAETVGPAGSSAGGRLVVTSATRLMLLRTDDLGDVAFLDGRGAGLGFARATAAVSGNLAFVARDGSDSVPAAQLALRLDTGGLLDAGGFAAAAGGAGAAAGQPAIARGNVVFGMPTGAYAYRTRDASAPLVELLAPAAGARIDGTVDLAARAEDDRGVVSVQFRLIGTGAPRVLAKVASPQSGSPFDGGARYAATAGLAGVPAGEHQLEAVATDAAGNAGTSLRRRVVVTASAVVGPPGGSCAVTRRGSRRADRMVGGDAGERFLGFGGDDRLDGRGGHDCLLGGAGRDRLTGGDGNDRLEGGAGRDRLNGGAGADVLAGGGGGDAITGGSGRNRISGGAGSDRIAAVNRRRDVIRCGGGHDRVRADRADKVARDCERVLRVRR